MYVVFARTQMRQRNGKCHTLRNDCGCRRTAYAPMKLEDKQRIKHQIHRHGGQHYGHRFARIARGAYHVVHAQIEVRDDIARQNYLHKLPCVGDGFLGGAPAAEKHQYRVEKQQHQHHHYQADDHIEQCRIAERLFGSHFVAFAQPQRDGGACAHAHHSTKRRTDVHYRHRNGHTCNGCAAHTVSHKYAVDNVVDARRGHGDDGWQGVFGQQLAYAVGAEPFGIRYACVTTQIFSRF